MKKSVILSAILFLSIYPCLAGEVPARIHLNGQKNHVQGAAWDRVKERMYLSFTTRFVITDAEGEEIGSIEGIHGHLGAMTFDESSRKVYASLECKNDEIGSAISRQLGKEGYSNALFYIAEIDVDAIEGKDVPFDKVAKKHLVKPAVEDFNAKVPCGGKELDHRFGCSGIDGVTVAPGFGSKKGSFLYVAYGIYSDTTRTDNDYQVLLQYRKGNFSKPSARYFIKTGNTSYGVQNLAYDKSSGLMYLAVYKGKKSQYPNHTLFAVKISSKPQKEMLEGVPYLNDRQSVIPLYVEGWDFPYGSMGLCPLGDGRCYAATDRSTVTLFDSIPNK